MKAILRSGFLALAIVLALSTAFAIAQGADPVPRSALTKLKAIPLRSGINHVKHFAPDGRDAQIVLAWRENGNAHAYDLFLVLLPGQPGAADWNVAGVLAGSPNVTDDTRPFQDTILDAPHVGEDMVRSIRFARGRVEGKPGTFLLTATRDWSDEGIPAPSLVTFEAFSLTPSLGDVGVTRDYFKLLLRTRSTTKFCNAEVALALYFGLPARRQTDWPNTPSGCP